MKIKTKEAIQKRLDLVQERIAQALYDGDWSTLIWNIALVLAILLAAVALGVGILAVVWKILGTLLGKVFAAPIVLLILGLSYNMNRKNKRKKREPLPPEEWADGIYEYVRDAMFLVLRAVSEYTNIVTPSRASAIELTDEPYTIEDGYVVFNFLGKIYGQIEPDQLKTDLERTLRQMHRAHELNGIPRDLTVINGRYYCPLQILGVPRDLGDHVQISVVFATEKTVELTRARKLLDLDHALKALRKQREAHGDDPLFR